MKRQAKLILQLCLCLMTILIMPPPQGKTVRASGATVFTHTATASNIQGSFTAINDPDIDDNNFALLVVTQNWNPDGAAGGVYNPHPIGVDRQSFRDQYRWVIYNRDDQPMTPGASFNVAILPAQPENFQRMDSTNVGPNFILFNHPLTNNIPNAMIITTIHRFGVDRHTPIFNTPIGVWYKTDAARWSGFAEDMVGTPSGIGFNVMAYNSNVGMVHRTTAKNIVGNSSYLDLPGANNNPRARLFVTHNWNPGGVGGTYFKKEVGVWYDTSQQRWAIFTQDVSPMPVGIAFNVMVAS